MQLSEWCNLDSCCPADWPRRLLGVPVQSAVTWLFIHIGHSRPRVAHNCSRPLADIQRRLIARAASPPATVPRAAENAIPNSANNHMASMSRPGNRRNTTAAATVEKAHGHTRRGLGLSLRAATTRVANDRSALTGKTRKAEKSTPQAIAPNVRFHHKRTVRFRAIVDLRHRS
jgi:hypothetical protein